MDSHAEKTLQRAVLALAGPESQRQRLENAFLHHVATLQPQELPAAMQGKFAELLKHMWARDIDIMTDDDVSTGADRLLDFVSRVAASG